MTQARKVLAHPRRILLGTAALVLVLSLVYTSWRASGPLPETASPSAPQSASSWQRIGLARFDEGKFAEAADAYSKATKLAPDSAILWSALGEALVMASTRDPLPHEARTAFHKALELDAKEPRARYFAAVERDLSGDHEGALDAWFALLADTPPDAPWHADLVRTIEQVSRINGIDTQARLANATRDTKPASPLRGQSLPGPTRAQIAEAARLSPGEQRQLAQGMVERLEVRLAADPQNVEGWVMLMRSRVNLGERDKAAEALAKAKVANPARADYLTQQAEALGLAP